ncbi:formylmethanofuran dehydrogenase subunit E [Desulfonatronum thiosulfatophilum]|uniref:Formylmethanofuran dehydrogenase subunit E n=1 Tax=Desulfonatronum thiosulfatophilum TaxID=617002 RepID=A0A1G6E023_9BACT|nr:FmdE family protein [Desulfonatronum thiosulfatophilum]SDB50365.1 formylmethanofuran dehydrogenase subunit E [Desulfonatronum thiosulfatophilum]
MNCTLTQEQVDRAVAFHGHECPGLWIGLRAAELCLRELGHNDDNPITAVVETDMCGVDGIQVLTGCTLGKGNLIHRDLGKTAFSFYRTTDGKALRAVFQREAMGPENGELRELMKKVFSGSATTEEQSRAKELKTKTRRRIFEASLEDLFTVTEPTAPAPRSAKILDSLNCVACGESTMESRTRRFAGQTYCIPCFAVVEQKV